MRVFVALVAALLTVQAGEVKKAPGQGTATTAGQGTAKTAGQGTAEAAEQGTAKAAGRKTPKATVRTAARPDAEVEADIKRRFARSKISADQFTVRVSGGVAVIEGKTKIIQRKGVATRLAKLGGARSVDNRIQIDEAARAAAAAKLEKSRTRSDGHGGERRRVQVSRSEYR
jgi:hypothetical protein